MLIDIITKSRDIFFYFVDVCNQEYRFAHDLEFYRELITMHRNVKDIVTIIKNDEFCRKLYSTLEAWDMDKRGAKLNEFEIVKGVSGLRSMLIFNHERRTEPKERSRAFEGDTDLITYCEKSNINLVPVYEIFRMVMDMRKGLLSKEEAKKLLKINTGLFVYTLKV